MENNNYRVMDLGYGIYRVACDCIDDDHDITFNFDYDSEFNLVELNFYMNLDYVVDYYSDSHKDNFIKKFFKMTWFRIKYIFIFLFKGHVKLHRDIMFTDPDHINNFIHALNKSYEWMENYREKLRPKE